MCCVSIVADMLFMLVYVRSSDTLECCTHFHSLLHSTLAIGFVFLLLCSQPAYNNYHSKQSKLRSKQHFQEGLALNSLRLQPCTSTCMNVIVWLIHNNTNTLPVGSPTIHKNSLNALNNLSQLTWHRACKCSSNKLSLTYAIYYTASSWILIMLPYQPPRLQ